jgi:hypothetical protein
MSLRTPPSNIEGGTEDDPQDNRSYRLLSDLAGDAAAQTGGLPESSCSLSSRSSRTSADSQHATGVMDGPTRHAIAVCNKKYGTQGNGAALLAAMNVGFNTGDNEPQGGMGPVMGNDHDMSMSDDSGHHAKMKAKSGKKAKTHSGGATGTNRGDMDRDAYKHGVDSTSGGVDVDARTDDRRMAHDSAMAGRRDGRVRNPGVGKRTKAGRDSISH